MLEILRCCTSDIGAVGWFYVQEHGCSVLQTTANNSDRGDGGFDGFSVQTKLCVGATGQTRAYRHSNLRRLRKHINLRFSIDNVKHKKSHG